MKNKGLMEIKLCALKSLSGWVYSNEDLVRWWRDEDA